MPLPKGLAKFNRRVTNHITGPFAARLPGFAVLHHTGRVSGKAYQTPLNAWRDESEVVVALTYGPGADWLKNAQAATTSVLVMGGNEISVGQPESILTEQGMERVPGPVAAALRVLDVEHFVVFSVIS